MTLKHTSHNSGQPFTFNDNVVEIMAEHLHNIYVANFSTAPPKLTQAYNDITEEYKEFNRNFVRDIPRKLTIIGCGIIQTDEPPPFMFSEEQLLQLSQIEHERWVEERTSEGWRYNHTNDTKHKTHRFLVAWDQLSETEREKDITLIKAIPSLLALVGYGIVE